MPERSHPTSSKGEAGSHVEAWHPAQLVLVHIPGRGDDHDDESCGAHRALYRQGLPLLQRLHSRRRAMQDPVRQPQGDTVCYNACSNVGMRHTGGLLP